MKVFRHSILLLFALLCGLQGQAQQQRFFNLTVDDIAIDTMLPRFSYAIPLGKHYADSIYTLEIRYPEFLDMGRRDSLRYLALAPSADPGRLPEIEQHIVVDRKKGRLDFSLCPVVRRKGRLQFLVSFMIAVTSQPKPALKAPSRAGSQGDSTSQEDAAIYAKHSVLREGRWVKIRVPESGIYQLTSQLARQAGFSDLSRVRIFGYGGNLQNEELHKGDLAATDDLPEVASTMIGDRRLFYAKGPVSWENKEATRRTRNPYSDYGYYFLTETDGKTPLMVDSAQIIADCYPWPTTIMRSARWITSLGIRVAATSSRTIRSSRGSRAPMSSPTRGRESHGQPHHRRDGWCCRFGAVSPQRKGSRQRQSAPLVV